MSHVTGRSVVVASEQQVSSDLCGEAVILHLTSGVYYGLNAVGASVWALLREARTVRELEEAIQVEYAVDAERCRNDLMALLRELEAEDLIEVREADAEDVEPSAPPDR